MVLKTNQAMDIVKKLGLLAFISMFLLVSCADQTDNGETTQEATELGQSDSEINQTVEKVFYTIPNPFQISRMLKRAGAKYYVEILNNPLNVADYSSEKQKALNLGVYGADLCYASIHEQNQETMNFLAASKELSDALGISSTFKETFRERLQANIEDQDSVLSIISESFYDTDEFLKNEERPGTSVMILVGGWVEGLFIATKLLEYTDDREEIIRSIADQKFSLGNVVSLLSSDDYVNDPNLKGLLVDLKILKDIYDGVDIKVAEETKEEEPTEGSNVIGLNSSLELSPEQVVAITKKIAEIRTGIVE